MNKNDYYDLLVKQYYESISNNPYMLLSNIGYNNFNKNIINWLKERQKIANRYVEFLKSNGKDITTMETAEVEKGKHDSVASAYNTTIITPYFYPENKENKNKKILRYSFLPTSDVPGLLKFDNAGNLKEILCSPGYISTYITENPYSRNDLFGFEELCNSNYYDIIVGMYGNIYDGDKQMKLNNLKRLRDKLIGNDIEFKYDVDNNYYFAMVASNKNKDKVKIR